MSQTLPEKWSHLYARIAELEAERDYWRGLYICIDDDRAKLEAERDKLLIDHAINLMSWQAERDRLKTALEKIKAEADNGTHVFNLAYYALSSGETG